jgi:hypothetical protein
LNTKVSCGEALKRLQSGLFLSSELKQGKNLNELYEHQLLAQKTKTWKTEKILFYPKNGRRKAFSHG